MPEPPKNLESVLSLVEALDKVREFLKKAGHPFFTIESAELVWRVKAEVGILSKTEKEIVVDRDGEVVGFKEA